MSDNISSNVLFHFTRKMGDLINILKFGFSPRYCLEYTLDRIDGIAGSKRHHPANAIPMVCFCDLPLSLIKNHLKEYGGVGIGLQKKWGIRHGIEPVLYTHSSGQTRKPMARLAIKATSQGARFGDDLKLLSAYTKPFKGKAWRRNRIKSNVPFYDEREWRFVPTRKNGAPLFLPWKDYRDDVKRTAFQKLLEKDNTLRVCASDIQYLIVPWDRAERNVLELHRHLKRIFKNKELILATTTIMTGNCLEDA